jgi:acyl carrier protein/D-alanine--poly(phosphoribitol) ligase subunit 2
VVRRSWFLAAAGTETSAPGTRDQEPHEEPGAKDQELSGFFEKEFRVKDIILDYIKNEYLDEEEAEDLELNENTPLISSGIVDSFSMVSLKRFLEKKYQISIPDAEATPEAFDTVKKIITLVNKHRKDA